MLALLTIALAASYAPQDPVDPEQTPAGRAVYLGREVAKTMHWTGATWLMLLPAATRPRSMRWPIGLARRAFGLSGRLPIDRAEPLKARRALAALFDDAEGTAPAPLSGALVITSYK